MDRRSFIKYSLISSGGILAGCGGRVPPPEERIPSPPPYVDTRGIKYGNEVPTICCFCGVGCGALVTVATINGEKKAVNVEGDPDHPINEGRLCSKGAALYQIANNERRLNKVLYRAPRATDWSEITWDEAIEKIAQRIKDTRDANFITQDSDGKLVNRCESIAALGGAANDNEEAYLYTKLMRALGVVYLEHQARLCHSSTVPALAESFGRGAMTNHWIDIKNADVILVMGANPAENHPMAYKFITQAREERGAKLIVCDPRFTRSASLADVYAPFRSGTDIAFLGGMINYIIQNKKYNEEYVKEYTTASFRVCDDYDFNDGLFIGYDAQKRSYDKTKWAYKYDQDGKVMTDKTLEHPRCVFQLLKKHYERYDLDTVSKITGTPKEKLIEVYELFSSTGAPDKAGTILYAMGTTQHTYAVQMIRAYSIIQLLLGNIGIAGGGINAMRGESNVQTSTDHAILFHILPGYLAVPRAKNQNFGDPSNPNADPDSYLNAVTPKTIDDGTGKSKNWWTNAPKYAVSLLRAWWPTVTDNQIAYSYLPKAKDGADYSWLSLWNDLYEGNTRSGKKIEGMIIMGMNPAVGGSNQNLVREALGKLKWLVVMELWETETAAFWKRPGVDPAKIDTEVFLLPAACSYEKEGSITNSGRWAQWRWKAVEPPGEAKDDLWILNKIALKLKELYSADSNAPNRDAIINLSWDYGDPPDVHKVAKEINGYALDSFTGVAANGSIEYAKGRLIKNFFDLRADGKTACGNWLFCGSYNEDGNMMARRKRSTREEDPLGLNPEWAWCWPVNRRILYNRASVRPDGTAWDENRRILYWDADAGKWVTSYNGRIYDVVDGYATSGADKVYPFIMKPEGLGKLFGNGLADGPFPEHYEPWESPVKNLLSSQQNNPVIYIYSTDKDKQGTPEEYPYVATTFRLSEHWQAGAMTRNLPWQCELQPVMFIEISEELAAEKGIKNGDMVKVKSARGEIQCFAMVTKRLKPFNINGKTIHQVAMPWHYGYQGIATGDSANILTPNIGDPNTRIPEFKAFLVDIEKI